MLVRTPSWAQTAALNPNTPICISCGTALPSALAGLGALLCRECGAASSLVVPPFHARGLRQAA